MKKSILVISLTSLLLCSCSSVPSAHEKYLLNGMVYDSENRPAVNYKIYLDEKLAAISDIGGRFAVKNVKRGEHNLSGEGNGYLKINEKIQVYDKNQIVYIRVPAVETKFKEAFEYIKNGKYEKAEECINEVLECKGDNLEAVYFLCVINYLNGKTEESKKLLEEIKEKGGESNYVYELEKIVSGT